jgi:5-methylcytosine-specific restriction protein A
MASRPPERRPHASARGYGARWQRYRMAYLREHPLCVECLSRGRTEAATDVDHVRPATGPDDPTFYDPANHQALCHRHHSRKTATSGDGRRAW